MTLPLYKESNIYTYVSYICTSTSQAAWNVVTCFLSFVAEINPYISIHITESTYQALTLILTDETLMFQVPI